LEDIVADIMQLNEVRRENAQLEEKNTSNITLSVSAWQTA
jgi:hypothetical protein